MKLLNFPEVTPLSTNDILLGQARAFLILSNSFEAQGNSRLAYYYLCQAKDVLNLAGSFVNEQAA